ncbi:LETM1 domain-containing protein ylh47 [Dipsacomyces acuminosporus]|nr:LETM1 domain-containing protein ylh47 [Dipsacomyces acuminosporus]
MAKRPLSAFTRPASKAACASSKILGAVRANQKRVPRRSELLSQLESPRALYFQIAPLSTVRNCQSMLLRSETPGSGNTMQKRELSSKEVAARPAPEPKKTLMEKIKHEALHYWHGTKLFAKEVKISSKLVTKAVWGGTLTRREQRQLRRTVNDTVRLVPFLMFVIIPFAELLLPVALKLFPNMLPSTYEDKASAEKKRQKVQKMRNEMSTYLKETIAEMAKQRIELRKLANDGEVDAAVEDTADFLSKIRSSGEAVSTADLLRVANIFEDELTLDNLSRPQLVSICRYIGANAFGTDNYLKYQITNRMRYIRADDKMIKSEGIDSLSVPELQTACQARGIRTIGVSPARMRMELAQWIELHLHHNIPATLLILSRIITAGEPLAQQQQQFNVEALQATINSLPDNLVNEATLRLAEASGTATNKQKLEVLEEQEELIEDEDEQEKKKKEEDQKKLEEEEAAAAATTEAAAEAKEQAARSTEEAPAKKEESKAGGN